MAIILLLMAIVFTHQYVQARDNLLNQLKSTLEERALNLTGILHRLSSVNEFMRHFSQYHLATAPDDLPASPLISMMEHHEQGNFFYIDHVSQPYQRHEVGSVIIGGNTLDAREALANKKIGAALELFAYQHIIHNLNPFIVSSYCVFWGSIGNIYPWVPSEKIALSFKDPKHASKEIGGGQTRSLVSPENNPQRLGVWTKAYVDKVSKKLTLTRAAPVYLNDRSEGFVCIDVSLDFLSQFAEHIEPFDASPLLVNREGQVLAGAAESKTELQSADDVFFPLFNMGLPELNRHADKRFELIQGVNVISLPLGEAGWNIIYSIPEWRIARFLFSGFFAYPVLLFCMVIFFMMIHRALKTNYILPSLMLIDYIRSEASGIDLPVPAVPAEWEDSFLRLSKVFELKTVTANIPGGIFSLVQNHQGDTSLQFASRWISGFLGTVSNDPVASQVDWMDIFHPDDRQMIQDALVVSAEHLSLLNFECRLNREETNQKWIRVSSHPRRIDTNIVWDGLILDISDRKLAELKLRQAFEEKEVLLREISHRTKNNMQVIHSLLSLQSACIDDPKVRDIFKETQNRILSMAKVHQMLYQTQDLARIDFKTYLYDLSTGLIESYQSMTDKVRLDFQGEPVAVSLDTAITCGLVVNELISNALKYAFPGNRHGVIRIRLLMDTDQLVHLQIGDSGVGFPENFDFTRATSLGVQLITSLVKRQLKGTLTVDSGCNPEFRICFKNKGLLKNASPDS